MDRAKLEDLVVRFTDAFNADDLDGVMAFFAEDGIYDEFTGVRSEGTVAIRAAFAPQFEGQFGTVRFHTEDMFVDPEAGKALIRWSCSLATAKGPAAWRGLDILQFRPDGKLVEKLTYAKAKVPLLGDPTT